MSSMKKLKMRTYNSSPKLKGQCQTSSTRGRFQMDIQHAKSDGDLGTVDKDAAGEMKSAVELRKGKKYVFHLNAEKRDPEAGQSKRDKSTNMIVNHSAVHHNKPDRQRVLSPSDDENKYLGAKFRQISIVPDQGELLQPDLRSDLPVNLVGKRFVSIVNYLETHFRLLREDCIGPLRQGIKAHRRKQPSREIRIYQGVRFAGYRCGQQGMEYRVTFHDSEGNWEASKRLIYGALVCLSCDGFRNSIILAVVNQNPVRRAASTRYAMCLRVMSSSEAEGDEPLSYGQTYVMLESATAYFEAYYHVLKNLQMEDMENISFKKHFLDLEQQVDPPLYLRHREQGDEFDFEPVFPSIKTDIGRSFIHVLQEWPQWSSSLDQAQLHALRHGLTKELSVIQGPPGTGKTFLGLLLVRLLLANFKPLENKLESGRQGAELNMVPINTTNGSYGRKGPILVICMTNHALDQFLEGICKFEQKLIRVGARSNSSILQGKTLKKLLDKGKRKNRGRKASSLYVAKREAWDQKRLLEAQIRLCIGKSNVKLVGRQELSGIATNFQIQSLFSTGLDSQRTLERWLKGDVRMIQPEDHFFEESILKSVKECSGQGRQPKMEKMKNNIQAKRGRDAAAQHTRQVLNQFQAMHLDDQNEGFELQLQYLVTFPNVWRLTQEQRRILHQYWLHEVNVRHKKQLRRLTEEHERICRRIMKISEEIRVSILREANVVGITTTTAARCRNILKDLNSEILIVEEAAEVLEGHVLGALTSCVKHLVLIGDHLQLRPSTAVYELATKHKLDVSMFERLVEGGVEYVTLQEQRRMRPSFSKLVRSLYPNLKDHESVTKYESIRGVKRNLLFFDHNAQEESTTGDSSKVNTAEAKLVVELTLYLLKQDCYSAKNIAIITMYSAQIMEIRKLLKEGADKALSKEYLERVRKRMQEGTPSKDEGAGDLLPRVSSVDDFQGEEADIIILSLVRSNTLQTNEGIGTIGFLKTSNRICVALTRARKGMYIFGNATLLAKRSELWSNVIGTLRNDNALDKKLELVCQNHPETVTSIRKKKDFVKVGDGGCNRPCMAQLKCGHVCPKRCHPGSHDDVVCPDHV